MNQYSEVEQIYTIIRETLDNSFTTRHSDNCFVVVNTKRIEIDESPFRVQKRMGCMLGKDNNQVWQGQLGYWECLFNATLYVSQDLLSLFAELSTGELSEKRKTFSARMKPKYLAIFKDSLAENEAFTFYDVWVTYHKKAQYLNITFKFKSPSSPVSMDGRPFESYLLNIHVYQPSRGEAITNAHASTHSLLNIGTKRLLFAFWEQTFNTEWLTALNVAHKFRRVNTRQSIMLTDHAGNLTRIRSDWVSV